MDRLTRIQIENLACFGVLDLAPGDATLLLGGNGAGKSTLLDVMHRLGGLVNERAEIGREGFAGYTSTAGTARLKVEVSCSGDLYDWGFFYELDVEFQPRFQVTRELLKTPGSTLTEFSGGTFASNEMEGPIALEVDRSPLAVVKFPDDSGVKVFKAWAEGIWLLRLEPRRMAASAEQPEEQLAVSGENFVAWLLSARDRRSVLNRISQAARRSIPDLTSLALRRSGREHVLVATFASGAQIDFDWLSDGQRCLIVLHAVFTLLKRRRCTLLLLDEPDAHVTPTEILPLFTALRQRAHADGVQVMVASHHPQVIDLMASDAPWEMIMREGRVSAEPFRVDRASGVSASRHLLLRGRR